MDRMDLDTDQADAEQRGIPLARLFDRYARIIAKEYGLDKNYTLGLIERGRISEDKHDLIINAQNAVSRNRLDILLATYSDKENILASVGYNHRAVFE